MSQKPSIPKGTRDFSPSEVFKRNFIMQTIKKHFEIFGFQPIETPSFENLETLLGKYGDEGDRLIFKILNSGDFISKVDDVTYSSKRSSSLLSKISEKALRYDLTVPFARYVVMHQNELQFPFKRYQIQPVWRADRPQKGRFREFFQCDADAVGSNSLFQEVEFIQLYDAVFADLGLKGVTIKLNNRKVLSGIAEVIGITHLLVDFTVSLDKLDKIGEAGVVQEMLKKGIPEAAVERAVPLFRMQGTVEERLQQLRSILAESEEGLAGVAELQFVLDELSKADLSACSIELDVTLARGLNYYTGIIVEVAPPSSVKMGSIGGGGRYDDLTSNFGLKDISGVGISFGLDRIYLVLEELDLFAPEINQALDVLVLNFGDKEGQTAFGLVQQLRKLGVKTDFYPSAAKMQKQMKYANNRRVPYVVLVGEKETSQGVFVVKNMASGAQITYKNNQVQEFVESL